MALAEPYTTARELVALIERRAADALAAAAVQMIDAGIVSARSAVGDAVLEYAQLRHASHDPIESVRRADPRRAKEGTVYEPPPLNCPHGRQTAHCAECAPLAEAKYRAWLAAKNPTR